MSATATVNAFECNLITEEEALEQAMVDTMVALYQKAIFELAPHLAIEKTQVELWSC